MFLTERDFGSKNDPLLKSHRKRGRETRPIPFFDVRATAVPRSFHSDKKRGEPKCSDNRMWIRNIFHARHNSNEALLKVRARVPPHQFHPSEPSRPEIPTFPRTLRPPCAGQ